MKLQSIKKIEKTVAQTFIAARNESLFSEFDFLVMVNKYSYLQTHRPCNKHQTAVLFFRIMCVCFLLKFIFEKVKYPPLQKQFFVSPFTFWKHLFYEANNNCFAIISIGI